MSVAMQHGSFKHEKHLHQDAARQIKIMMNTCFVNKMECSITKVEISGLQKEKSLYYVYAQHSVGALLLFYIASCSLWQHYLYQVQWV